MARSGLKEDALADRNKDSSSHDQTWLRQKKQMGRIIDVGERAAWLRLVFLRREMWKAKKKEKEYGWNPARGSFLFAVCRNVNKVNIQVNSVSPFSAFPIIAQRVFLKRAFQNSQSKWLKLKKKKPKIKRYRK